MWILLHGWKCPLWKYPVPAACCCRFFRPSAEIPALRERSAGRYPSGNVFKTGFPYAAEPVIIIRFCDAMTGTPADNAHARRAALAVPDLRSPFPETALLSHHSCF